MLLHQSHSLKHKRQLLRSLKVRIRNQFNVSVAEVDYFNLWQRTKLAIVQVSTEKNFTNQVLDKIMEVIKSNSSFEVINYSLEMM
jgi:hypothetical protein